MRKTLLGALALTLLGVVVSAGTTWAQDTTAPVVTFTSPSGTFTRCQTLTITATITEETSTVVADSIVVQVGTATVPATIGGTAQARTVSASFNLQTTSVPFGTLSVTIIARDEAGNEVIAVRNVTIDCTFACAQELIVRASAANAFICPIERTIFDLVGFAGRSGTSRANRIRALELALECVQRTSRIPRFLGRRAHFANTAAAEEFARLIEEEIMCLLAEA